MSHVVEEQWYEDDGGIPEGVEHFWDAIRTTPPEDAPHQSGLYALYDGPDGDITAPGYEEVLIGRYDEDADALEVELRCSYAHLRTDVAMATGADLDYDRETALDDGYDLRFIEPDDRLPLQKEIAGVED